MQPVNRYCRPPAHPTKWTVVVDRPREARALTLFDTQAEVHAEIIRLRERGVEHVFALAPLAACGVGVNSEIDRRSLLQEADADAEML